MSAFLLFLSHSNLDLSNKANHKLLIRRCLHDIQIKHSRLSRTWHTPSGLSYARAIAHHKLLIQ